MIDDLVRQQRIVSFYEEMALVSDQMLADARLENWDAVVQGERRCAEIIECLKTLGDLAPVVPSLRQQKAEFARQVLANDAAIRDLAQPRLRQLELKLNNPGNARRLANAYNATSRFD
jgi:flagellar protein FliT